MIKQESLEPRIRSQVERSFFSNEQKTIFWIYYINTRLNRDTFLPELLELSQISKPALYRAFREMDRFHYLRRQLKIVQGGKTARGKKWSLKLELANGSKEKAKDLYDIVMKGINAHHIS